MRKVGIRSVSIDDICRELGISKKTFYVYFESKDQLVSEMLALHEQKMERKMLHNVEAKTILQIIQEWVQIAKKTEKDLQQPPPIMYDLEKYYPALAAQHKEHLCEMIYRNLVRFIEKGQEEGIFRGDVDATLTAQLFAYSHYFMVETMQKYPRRREEITCIGKQGLNIMVRGILSEEGQKQLYKS